MAEASTCPPLIPSSITTAHKKIQPYIHTTPLLTCSIINTIASSPDPKVCFTENPPASANSEDTNSNDNSSSTLGSVVRPPQFNLYFKCENYQKIGAFKARGAHHAVIRLTEELGIEEVRRRGVVTHSSGNHAQALALAAKTFEIPSYIVMPSISTPSKISGTRLYTPNVIFSGSTAPEREAKVAEVMKETDAILVPPYDHPDIILGQGTVGREMEMQFRALKGRRKDIDGNVVNHVHGNGVCTSQVLSLSDNTQNGASSQLQPGISDDSTEPTFDAVIAPIGGGGLLGGVSTWFSEHPASNNTGRKRPLVFGAEPSFEGADDARRGLAQGSRIPHVSTLTIADGLRTPVGILNWEIVRDQKRCAGVFSVSEDEIKLALRLVFERMKVVIEPSAAVPLAVVLFCGEFREMVARLQREELGKSAEGESGAWDVGVVFSGGNTTMKALSKLFAASEEEGKERETGKVGRDGSEKAEDVAG